MNEIRKVTTIMIDLKDRVIHCKLVDIDPINRLGYDDIFAKKKNEILTYDEVMSLLKAFRPTYDVQPKSLERMKPDNRIVFLHHLAMMMSLDNYKERRSSDLALIECECIGLLRTSYYVTKRWPRTPVHQFLLDYVNESIERWYGWTDEDEERYGETPYGKPYYITWKDGEPFQTFAEVRMAFREAYAVAQTDFPSYVITTLPSNTGVSVPEWDDTYADIQRCMRGYLNHDETYTKYADVTSDRAQDVSCSKKSEKQFFQAVLDGKFDEVHECLRFYQTSAAGILLSHELGVLPFDLDKSVLWYLRQEVLHDMEFNNMSFEYEFLAREWEGCVRWGDGELPQVQEQRLRSGQGAGPRCVRLVKGWRAADVTIHNVSESIHETGFEPAYFSVQAEVLSEGVKLSVLEVPHQEVLYSVMTDDVHCQHRWNVCVDENRLQKVAAWYRIDTEELVSWLFDGLLSYPSDEVEAMIEQWNGDK